MTHGKLVLAAVICALGWTGTARAADQAAPQGERIAGLDITMRIIEDPDAMAAEGITRRLTLPSPADETETPASPAGGPVDGPEVSQAASEFGREFGEEVSDRARELADQASEQREDFGRSQAEELHPEMPEPPEIDPPAPPRP